MPYTIVALYHFAKIQEPPQFQQLMQKICAENDLCGLLLIAHEGINGTIAGSDDNVMQMLDSIKSQSEFKNIEYKLSYCDEKPFVRMKIKLKPTIINLGLDGLNVSELTGTKVAPHDWNQLINSDDVVLLDTRNDYELEIGKFSGAIDTECRTFSDFPAFVEANRDKLAGKKIAMYCTGGIRCEKASSYMLELGFSDVYQLHGGILKYLEDVPQSESLWEGDCFVFDRRTSVGHGVEAGEHIICGGCRRAVAPADMSGERYIAGVSCNYCYDRTTDFQKLRFAERQRQIVQQREKAG